MATSSFIAVTPGAGAKLATGPTYTDGGNVIQDEKVILGENYLSGYTISVFAVMTTAASHFVQIMAGASLRVRIRRIEAYQVGLATTAALTYFELWRLSSAGTGGTAVTPRPLDTADSAAGATAMTLPTVKGTETVQIALNSFVLTQTIGASMIMQLPSYVIDFDRPRTKPLIIPAGAANGIALKIGPGVVGASMQAIIYCDETAF